MKFLIYKIYRLAMTQEATAGTEFSFLIFISVFQLLHLLLIGLLIKMFGFEIQLPKQIESLFGILFVIIGVGINYYFFIKSGKIYEINSYYQNKNLSVIKENLVFWGYLLMLLVLLFIVAIYFIRYQ